MRSLIRGVTSGRSSSLGGAGLVCCRAGSSSAGLSGSSSSAGAMTKRPPPNWQQLLGGGDGDRAAAAAPPPPNGGGADAGGDARSGAAPPLQVAERQIARLVRGSAPIDSLRCVCMCDAPSQSAVGGNAARGDDFAPRQHGLAAVLSRSSAIAASLNTAPPALVTPPIPRRPRRPAVGRIRQHQGAAGRRRRRRAAAARGKGGRPPKGPRRRRRPPPQARLVRRRGARIQKRGDFRIRIERGHSNSSWLYSKLAVVQRSRSPPSLRSPTSLPLNPTPPLSSDASGRLLPRLRAAPLQARGGARPRPFRPHERHQRHQRRQRSRRQRRQWRKQRRHRRSRRRGPQLVLDAAGGRARGAAAVPLPVCAD